MATVAAAAEMTIRRTRRSTAVSAIARCDPRCVVRAARPLTLVLGVVAGCGSADVGELPPAAEPPRSPVAATPPAGRLLRVGPSARVVTQPGGVTALDRGRLVAVVSVRERVLELYDARSLRRLQRVPAGVGPTHVACLDKGPCYVADTQGNALLVFSPAARGELRLRRRAYLPGGPYGLALDAPNRRLYVTLPGRNELVELPAHGRPHILRRWPTVRQPNTVAVDPGLRRAYVTGKTSGMVQVLDVAAPR